MIGVKITGVGIAVPGYKGVPGRIVTNELLAKELLERGLALADEKKLQGEARKIFLKDFSTSKEWIEQRTGIERRSFADEKTATSDLAEIAVREALNSSGLDIRAVERLDTATVTPDYLMSPPTVMVLAHKLGLDCSVGNKELRILFGADTTVACSSFIAALQNLYASIASGMCRNGIVVGADIMSRTTNPNDRGFHVILGDGAGALVLEACDASQSAFTPESFYFGMDGRFADRIIAKAGGSRTPSTPQLVADYADKLWMDGRKVFKDIVPLVFKANNPMNSVIGKALARAKKTLEEIDCVFFHQANLRMTAPIEVELRKAGFRGEVFNNIQNYGNTTSASIPLLIAEAYEQGILKYGDTFLSAVFGGSYSWGTSIAKCTINEPC